MSKESKMEPLEKTWLLEIIVAAMLAALLGFAGWTATKVVQNGEKIVELNGKIAEVKVEFGKEIAAVNGKIAAVDAKLAAVDAKLAVVDVKIAAVDVKIAAVDAKLDLLIRGLNISVAPKDNAGAGPSGAKRGGFRVGAGETATE